MTDGDLHRFGREIVALLREQEDLARAIASGAAVRRQGHAEWAAECIRRSVLPHTVNDYANDDWGLGDAAP